MLDLVADPLRCFDDMPIVEMGIARRGPHIGVAEQLADHRQGFRMGSGMAGKAVPQIVDTNAGKSRFVAQLRASASVTIRECLPDALLGERGAISPSDSDQRLA